MHGIVDALWRYPVKSMLGESVQRALVGEAGLAGDRSRALIDEETGRVVSAKNPRRWPDMFSFSAAYVTEPGAGPIPAAMITMADGARIRSDDSGADATLSASLGRPVRITSVPPPDPKGDHLWVGMSEEDGGQEGEDKDVQVAYRIGSRAPGTFFDSSPVHLITTSTIRSLEAVEPGTLIDARRFRPNLVLDTDADGFPENDWLGRMLVCGDVVLQITRPTSRCVMTTLAQSELPGDPAVLRATAKGNRVVKDPGAPADPCAGVYAVVRRGGTITTGDTFRLS